jgi:hypothetical protein
MRGGRRARSFESYPTGRLVAGSTHLQEGLRTPNSHQALHQTPRFFVSSPPSAHIRGGLAVL